MSRVKRENLILGFIRPKRSLFIRMLHDRSSILSIPFLLSLVVVPMQVEGATTSLEAILAQGVNYPTQICISKGGTGIDSFTYSSKDCLQGGSTNSGAGTGTFQGEARAKTTYGILNTF